MAGMVFYGLRVRNPRLILALSLKMYVDKSQKEVTHDQLRQLLKELAFNSQVGFRYRLLGKMWQMNMSEVQGVSDNALVVRDRVTKATNVVPLRDIVQFELDERFDIYQPNFHYEVGNPFAQ